MSGTQQNVVGWANKNIKDSHIYKTVGTFFKNRALSIKQKLRILWFASILQSGANHYTNGVK